MPAAPAFRPGVTVVIPVKDRARLLAQTLRSLREQTTSVAEVIVVDDGSTDDSAAVAGDAGATVVAADSPGGGPSAARNAGLARVRTDLTCPLDSDDLLRPMAIEALANALERNPDAPFAFGRALEAARDAEGWHPTGIIAPLDFETGDLPCRLYARNFVPASAVVLRTRDILEAGGYPEWLVFNEDHYAWIQLARRGSPTYVPEVLGVSRRHAGSRHDPLAHSAVAEITRLSDDDPHLLPCRPERLGIQLVNMEAIAVGARRPGEAARTAWNLVARQPQRRRILRSGLRHWRSRRRLAREAHELWAADPELRRFLASYE
jgi:glycosyltransferase involved in cell wall biosynthesis